MSKLSPEDLSRPAVSIAHTLWQGGVDVEHGIIALKTSSARDFYVVGGINDFSRWLEGFRMPPSFLVTLRNTEDFSEDFIERLREERAKLNVFALSDGEVVGPGTPVLELHGSLLSLLLTFPRAMAFFREHTAAWTTALEAQEGSSATSLPEWDAEISTSVDLETEVLDRLVLSQGMGAAHVDRILDTDGMMVCDQVDYTMGQRPAQSRSLLIRYADNSCVCRPLPDKTRSAAYHQQSLGEIGSRSELVRGSRRIDVQVLI
jgi:hypothetical protein